MTQPEHPATSDTDRADDSKYYRITDVAAPDVGNAVYFNHPNMGWCPVLDVLTDIENDSVVIALGDTETGAYADLIKTFYGEYADVIVSLPKAPQLVKNYPDSQIEPADHLVEDLPADPPGAQNV
jgi:hypothetical protein